MTECDFTQYPPIRVMRLGNQLVAKQGTDDLLRTDDPVILATFRDTADAILKDNAGETR